MSLTLALSTSSPALSIALSGDEGLLAHRHELIGRGHAEALMPAIAMLVGSARPDRVLVDVGPGSFTGIRIGIAAARALGLAWGVPVLGCTAVTLVAARAFRMCPDLDCVTVLLDAGRGQLLRARTARNGTAGPIETFATPPVAAGEALAGAGTALLGPHAGQVIHDGQPDAADAAALHEAQRSLAPAALYVRPPDAVLPL